MKVTDKSSDMREVMADPFRGDNSALVSSIQALLGLDAAGALAPRPLGGHARTLLESAAARLSTPAPAAPQSAEMQAQAGGVLPSPGSSEASAMMDSVLAEYNHPSNPKNAARAGWVAAMRWLATPSPEAREPAAPEQAASAEERAIEAGDLADTIKTAIAHGDLNMPSQLYAIARMLDQLADMAGTTTAQSPLPEQAEAVRLTQVGVPYPIPTDWLRGVFERANQDTHGFKRSRRGNYQNPPISRDWKWFRMGVGAAQNYVPAQGPAEPTQPRED